jgi:hypothetical protein
MKSINKKAPGARGIPQTFNRPAGQVPQFKPVVAQLKTRVSSQSVKRPVAPPVFRPQPTPKVAQPKLTTETVNRRPPIAPPVYRPQPVPKVLQTKKSLIQSPQARQAPRPPIAPAVYRREAGKLIHPKSISQERKRPTTPPAYRPPQKRIAQPKMASGGLAHTPVKGASHSARGVVQRNLLPVGRHREVVIDSAKRLDDAVNASDNKWIQAIYAELDGEGNPGANKCADKLIEQHIIDQQDWDVIVTDFKLYKSEAGKGFDLFERHAVPRVHNEEEASKWVASLIGNRISDLYSTLPGFVGHAQQVQQHITSLVGWYGEGKFKKEAYDKFKALIIDSLKKGKHASNLQIPQHSYTFENYSTETV